jgi:ParB/RepB/Spo0J family partition protein
MKEMIKLEEIEIENNRKYTKDEGFEQLVSSIGMIGIIQSPVVRRLEDGRYRIVAGRRRIAAKKRIIIECGGNLKAEIECEVLHPVDSRIDEEIALAENVNRLEMHPLDEADLFSRMAERGRTIEEIAKYYARSPSGIYKRLRLTGLVEELKVMFRDGKLNIAGAAVLAELPEDDQKDFYRICEEKNAKTPEDDEEENEINPYALMAQISQFIQKKQHFTIIESMKGCDKCAKRTHNENNALFKEYEDLNDVCLDADCYRVKWQGMVSAALKTAIVQMNEGGVNTDNKIFFKGGVPEEIYKKASSVRFKIEKADVEFEVLREKDYDCTGETSRKKDACWQIYTNYSGKIDVRRVGYKAKPPKEKPIYGETKSEVGQEIERYGREALEAVVEDRQMPSAQVLVQSLKSAKVDSWDFNDKIKKLVIGRVIAKRIEKESGEEPPRNYLSMLMKKMDEDCFGDKSFDEKEFDDQQKKWLRDMFGNQNIKQISAGLSDETQWMFHFLLLSMGFDDVPDLETAKKIAAGKNTDNIFWNYAAMDYEEYKALYLEAAKEATAEALEPKAKKSTKKKKPAGKEKAAVNEDEEEDNYPFEPDLEDEGEETD